MSSLQNRVPAQYRDTVIVQELESGNVSVRCIVDGQTWQPQLQTGGHLPNGWWKCPNKCYECVDWEPPYTRADEMADQANADYWDEVARSR